MPPGPEVSESPQHTIPGSLSAITESVFLYELFSAAISPSGVSGSGESVTSPEVSSVIGSSDVSGISELSDESDVSGSDVSGSDEVTYESDQSSPEESVLSEPPPAIYFISLTRSMLFAFPSLLLS